MSVTPTQTQIVLGESTTLTAAVTAANCDPAPTVSWSSDNTAAVSIQANGNQAQITGLVASATPVTVTASVNSVMGSSEVTVVPRPSIALDVSSLMFTATQGGANPASQAVTITNDGGGALSGLSLGTITYGAGASGWVNASVLSSTTASPSVTFSVQPVTGSLAPGAYTATIPVLSSVASNSPIEVAVTFTVTSAVDPSLTIVGGNLQTGLAGRALADSLAVRLTAPGGAPIAGATVNWMSAQGSLSPASGVTGADGTAWTQWTVASGAGNASATVTGVPSAAFTATGRAGASCQLAPSPATQRFSLGPTDFTLSLNAATPIRIVVLFTDFGDAPATETPAAIMANIVNPGLALLQELSYGRVSITATADPTWYRMSQPIGSYTWSTFAGHHAYFTEAMTLANAAVDFSQYEAVYIFAPPSPAKPNSPTFNGGQTNGLLFDGRVIGNGVTFGQDARSFPASIVAHETGHMFGLVDLYAYNPPVGGPFSGNQFQFTGSWSLMADVFRPAHYFAWEKRKLGWLQASEWDCLEAGAGIEVVLDPVSTAGGIKMVAMPTGPSTAIVAEVRRLAGLDANMCVRGVLVYDVDATVASGQGPARIRGSRQNTGVCGPWTDATFDVGAGQISTLNVPGVLEMRLLGVDANGRYRVRFRRP